MNPEAWSQVYEIPHLLPLPAISGDVRASLAEIGTIFADLGDGELGCRGLGFGRGAHRYFIKFLVDDRGLAPLRRAMAVHARVLHPTLIPLIQVLDGDLGPILVFPWVDAAPLRHSLQMAAAPLPNVLRAITDIIDVHSAIEAAGFVSIDLYDGNLLYSDQIWLIDVDEYQPQPFVLEGPRTLGSTRFMAPEEFQQGASLDSRTMVFQLGRAMAVLLDPPSGEVLDRCPQLGQIIGKATSADPAHRYQTVAAMAVDFGEALAHLTDG